MKPIKNVLELYDNGKRDLILQYKVTEFSRTRGKGKWKSETEKLWATK